LESGKIPSRGRVDPSRQTICMRSDMLQINEYDDDDDDDLSQKIATEISTVTD